MNVMNLESVGVEG